MVRIQGRILDPTQLYEQMAARTVDVQTLAQAFDFEDAFDLFGGDPNRVLPGETASGSIPPEIAQRLTRDPRAVLAQTQQAREISGMQRAPLEAAIKEFFAQLNKDGVPLEARPGSKLAEAMATGDLSELSSQELMAVLIAMALYAQNRNNPGNAAGGANNPLAPRGSWGPRGNSHGGGTSRTGANGDASSPTGPAPNGPAPGGTASGQSLAQSAARVANRMGSTGYCYRGVKAAVREATGVQLTGGSAYQAAGQLAGSGRFNEVQVSPSELRNLPPGAVVVWGKTSRSPHGHISVALGDGREASDHIQSQMTSLRGAQNYRVFIPR